MHEVRAVYEEVPARVAGYGDGVEGDFRACIEAYAQRGGDIICKMCG